MQKHPLFVIWRKVVLWVEKYRNVHNIFFAIWYINRKDQVHGATKWCRMWWQIKLDSYGCVTSPGMRLRKLGGRGISGAAQKPDQRRHAGTRLLHSKGYERRVRASGLAREPRTTSIGKSQTNYRASRASQRVAIGKIENQRSKGHNLVPLLNRNIHRHLLERLTSCLHQLYLA